MNLVKYKHLLIIVIMPLLFLYKMVFLGQIITTNDEYERHPINEWRDNYFTESDDIPQWFPNIFSGMPSYGGYIFNNGDPTKFIRSIILFNPGLKVWFYLCISALGMFLLLRMIGTSKNSSLFGALVASLTPYSFGLINAGHLNKIFAMAYIPWVLLAGFSLIKNLKTKYIFFLALANSLQLWVNHPQISYYTWMVLGFYFFWKIGLDLKSKNFNLKDSGLKLLYIKGSILISLLFVSDPYLDIYKFQSESTRGAKSVLDQTNQTSRGASWTYATQWSFHPREMISFIYPYYFGLQNTQDLKKGAYWGYMSFTQSTHYLGIIAILLAILGPLLKKPDKFEIFFWVVTILTIFTGFGSHFPVLYRPFYEFFPFFSKFRIPSMIYVLLAVSVPILAAKSMDSLSKNIDDKIKFKKLLYVTSSILALTIILLFVGESLLSFMKSSESLRYSQDQISYLKNARVNLFNKGLILCIIVVSSFISLCWLFKNKQIKRSYFYYLVITLSLADIWYVSSEFMNLKPKKNMDKLFKSNPAIRKIQEDMDYFRVFPADEIRSNKYSYWNIESIGGYRPIKLRNYEDLMSAKGFSIPHVLNMLNVKYVITRRKINNTDFEKVEGISNLYENKKVLPKAWFVGKAKNVNSQRASLMETLLSSFDPSDEAVVLNYEGPLLPNKVDGSIEVKLRKENQIILKTNSSTGGLMVLSETYYKPGWKATINGSQSKIYQTNHILRSVYVPKGKNEIIFWYDTSLFNKTRILSRISLFIVLFSMGVFFRKKY